MSAREDSNWIKATAQELGFISCGISKAAFLEAEAPRLEQWLKAGYHGSMGYMERNFDKRLDPTKLVPGAKSVISLLFNYYTPETQKDPEAPKISKYALGTDYHLVLKEKLKTFFQKIQAEFGDVEGRVFVDSAPILEKAWAAKSGLGWIGKNTNLLTQKVGSYYFIVEIICDLPLAYNHPVTDHCGSCTACIDACPTQALTPFKIDASKCISYLTIELKSSIPSEFSGQMDNWMFGCDVCQDVCPWNSFAKSHTETKFSPHPQLLEMEQNDWLELTEATFKKVFKNSAVQRTKFLGLQRNIRFLQSSQED